MTSTKQFYSIEEFCAAHAIKRATFYTLKEKGKAPKTMNIGSRVVISLKAAEAWRRKLEKVGSV